MNPDDYATLPYAKKLAEKGIVMETEKYWVKYPVWETWRLVDGAEAVLANRPETVPATSLAEMWRALKPYVFGHYEEMRDLVWTALLSDNPVNALAVLRCWLEERKEKV